MDHKQLRAVSFEIPLGFSNSSQSFDLYTSILKNYVEVEDFDGLCRTLEKWYEEVETMQSLFNIELVCE